MASASKKIRVPSAPAVHRLIFLVFDIPFSNSFYRRVYLILRKVSRSAAVSFDGAGSRPFNASASASSGCFLLIRFRTNIHARATASKHQITEGEARKKLFDQLDAEAKRYGKEPTPDNKADGGMMNKKLTKTVPPKKGPNSQGMRGTGSAIRGTKFKGVF